MSQPNVIVFLTDDQGYGDLSCMGSTDFCTPHLDRLALDGARLTDFYAGSSVCSPSRASLLTGRFPGNAGVRAILHGHRKATGLPEQVPTLPKILREQAGYQTYMSGKWHLGLADESRPYNQGFDHWYGFMAGCIDYYSHIFYWAMNNPGPGRNPMHDLWEDNEEIWDNGRYFTEAITDKAVSYIRQAAKSDEPFFLYVAYNAPHYPMHAPKEYMDRFAHLPWDRQVMAAMISAVDDGVGAIMAEVTRQGLAENTLTVFNSDNGPSRESRNWLDGNQDPYYGGTTGKLKGHKFSLYEGGIRVPGIIHWPGTIPGGQVLNAPCGGFDILPTVLDAAGIATGDLELDGTSILPYLAEGKVPDERDLFWELNGQTAMRRGDWKLVLNGKLQEGAPVEDDIHLSNLSEDMGELHNLKEQEPKLTESMKTAAETWAAGIEERWQREFSPERQGLTS